MFSVLTAIIRFHYMRRYLQVSLCFAEKIRNQKRKHNLAVSCVAQNAMLAFDGEFGPLL